MSDEAFAQSIADYDVLIGEVVAAFANEDRTAGRAELVAIYERLEEDGDGLVSHLITPAFLRVFDQMEASARQVAEQALQNPPLSDDVLVVSSRMMVTGLASSASGARPVQIMGVDPLSEAAFTTLNAQTVEGRYLEPDDRLAAFVGKQLVESLDLRLGSRLVLNAQDVHNDIGGQLADQLTQPPRECEVEIARAGKRTDVEARARGDSSDRRFRRAHQRAADAARLVLVSLVSFLMKFWTSLKVPFSRTEALVIAS